MEERGILDACKEQGVAPEIETHASIGAVWVRGVRDLTEDEIAEVRAVWRA